MAAYTNIDDPSAYFQTFTYAFATTPADRVFTFDGNSNLKPDFSWIKRRDSGDSAHILQDSSRGVTKYLHSNSTSAELTYASYLKSFNTNGLTIGGGDGATNQGSGGKGVIWAWKSGGGTTATNTAGSIDTTVQVNADAGFSIVTFTSPGSGVYSMGHGLGVTPGMIIFKNREATSQWFTWHKDLTNLVTGRLSLERTDAEEFGTASWGAGVTSTLFGLSVGMLTVANNDYVAYCFAEKQGYSKMSKYVGNGAASGPFVYTGFKPAFVMVKGIGSTSEWQIYDNKRPGYNFPNYNLSPNNDTAEYTGSSYHNMDLLSNGFKILLTDVAVNTVAKKYMYAAFAENPFVTSTGIPTTAR